MRAWALLLCSAAACSRCGGAKNAASAEELLPAHPSGAIVTAPLSALAQHLAALSDRAAALPGGEQLGDARKALSAQLGFDPFTRAGLLAAGIDPDRGAAVAILEARPRPEWVAALPLKEPALFAQTVQRLMTERFGASPGKEPQSFERGLARIAWRVARGYGMIARGAAPATLVAERKLEESLSRDAGLSAARQRLGAQDLILFAPQGSELSHRYTSRPLPGDSAFSLQSSAQGIAMRLAQQLPPPDAARVQAALVGGGAALVELLPPSAPLRARLGIAPERLLEWLRTRKELAPLLEKLHGADVEAAASVEPGMAFSLAVEKSANIGAAIDYGFDFRRKSPFDTVQLVALAKVSDKPRLIKAFESIAQAMPALGAKIARKGDDFAASYPGGKGARFGVATVEGMQLAYLLGGSIAPADLRRTPRSVNPEAAALYEAAGASIRADFGKLSDALRTLPESAYGAGPQAYVARSVMSQVIEPLRPLRVTLSAEAYPDRLGATLDVEIVAP